MPQKGQFVNRDNSFRLHAASTDRSSHHHFRHGEISAELTPGFRPLGHCSGSPVIGSIFDASEQPRPSNDLMTRLLEQANLTLEILRFQMRLAKDLSVRMAKGSRSPYPTTQMPFPAPRGAWQASAVSTPVGPVPQRHRFVLAEMATPIRSP